MNIHSLIENPQFYGRRRGRKLSKSGQLAIKYGIDYFIKEEEISNIFNYQKHIVLEIGFGDGENLINSAKINSNFFYIGADPFLNATAKCLGKILQYKLKNIAINKYFLIFSEKLLKRLSNEANITIIENIK